MQMSGLDSDPSSVKKSITSLDEFSFQIENLLLAGMLYRFENHTAYKLIAMVLRTLLLGSSGDPPYAETCLAAPKLPRLRISGPFTVSGHYRMPADIFIDSPTGANFHLVAGCHVKSIDYQGGVVRSARVSGLFGDDLIPLSDWTNQPFLGSPLTLQSFIKLIAHKEGGVHIDLTNPELKPLHDCGFLHWPLLAAMATPIGLALRQQLHAQHPSHSPSLP
jgi:hypothetical protein